MGILNRLVAFAALAVVLSGLAACQLKSIHPECGLTNHGSNVRIVGSGSDSGYEPQVLCVSLGATVEWQADDGFIEHSVTSAPEDPQAFDSGSLSNGRSFAVAFKKPGEYAYVCSFHDWMAGMIVVLDS